MVLIAVLAAFAAVVLGVVAVTLASRIGSLRGRSDAQVGRIEELEARLRRNRELETQLASSLDAMHLGVVVVGSDGSVAFRNRAAERYDSARHGPVLVESAVHELCELALQGVGSQREVELHGPPIEVHRVRGFPLRAEPAGTPVGALALVEDVTAARRVEQLRRDFVANISHELRTPVGAIGLLAETMAGESDPPTLARLAERMLLEAERVAATIDDLMELTRIEVGDEMSADRLDVGSVVGEAVARIRSGAEHRGVAVSVSDQDGNPIRTTGDRRQLVSAVYNLLDNAVKYSTTGSEVSVSYRQDGDRLVIEVVDQGAGIPARDVDRIFERFYRVDRARSRATGGTGLGLAIVRHVVANHRGTVTVRSREGEGSTFTISLPARPSGNDPSEGVPVPDEVDSGESAKVEP